MTNDEWGAWISYFYLVFIIIYKLNEYFTVSSENIIYICRSNYCKQLVELGMPVNGFCFYWLLGRSWLHSRIWWAGTDCTLLTGGQVLTTTLSYLVGRSWLHSPDWWAGPDCTLLTGGQVLTALSWLVGRSWLHSPDWWAGPDCTLLIGGQVLTALSSLVGVSLLTLLTGGQGYKIF